MTKPSWKHRRRVMWTSLLFSMAAIGYTIVFRASAPVATVVVTAGFGTITLIVGAYLKFGVDDDKNHREVT